MNIHKTIAVLLTCHNRKVKTISCLKSLYEATLPKGFSLEIFLVDDGSVDGTFGVGVCILLGKLQQNTKRMIYIYG